MRNVLLLLAALTVLGLAACDTTGTQVVPWGSGNDLGIIGPLTGSSEDIS